MLEIISAISERENESERALVEKLFLDYSKYVRTIAVNILNNQEDAKDAVMETFLKVIHYREKFIGLSIDSAKALLIIYTRCTCYDILNKRHKVVLEDLDNYKNDDLTAENFELSYDVNVLNNLIKQETIEKLNSAIEALEEPMKDIIKLKFFCDMSNEDIAKLLGINASTVGTYIWRGKMKLKKTLEDYINDENK